MTGAEPAAEPAAPEPTPDATADTAQRGWAWRLVDGGRSVLEAIDPALSPRFLLGSIGGLLLGVLALVIYVRSGDTLVPVPVRLTGPLTRIAAPSGARVRIAVAPGWASHESFEPYDAFAQYLGAQLGRAVAVTQRRTQGEVNELVAQAKVQAAVVSAGAYLHALAQRQPLQALVVPVAHGSAQHQSLILVTASSDLHALPELRGHSFAFTDPYSLAGYADPVMTVAPLTAAGSAFFSRTLFSYSDEESIRAVLNGNVDAAAVDSHVFAEELDKTPALRASLRVLHSSASYARGPVVVPAGLDPGLRSALLAALLGMHTQPEGRAVLAGLHLERFIEPPAGAYDDAAQVVAQLAALPKVAP